MKWGSLTDSEASAILQLSSQNCAVFHFHNRKTKSCRNPIYGYSLMAAVTLCNTSFDPKANTILIMDYNYYGHN